MHITATVAYVFVTVMHTTKTWSSFIKLKWSSQKPEDAAGFVALIYKTKIPITATVAYVFVAVVSITKTWSSATV